MPYKKSYGNYKPKNPYMDDQKSESADFARPTKEGRYRSDTIDFASKMLKDLPSAGSIMIKADVYAEGAQADTKYPLLTTNNRILNPVYAGDPNLEGGSAMQMYDAPNSAFLNKFDALRYELKSHYRYMELKGDNANFLIISGMFKSFLDQLDKVEASTFTELKSFNDIVVCDYKLYDQAIDAETYALWEPYQVTVVLPDPTSETTPPATINVTGYTGAAAVFLEAIHYQEILQNAISAFSSINKERMYRSHVMMMGYDREAGRLNSLWGRFNALSWISNWKDVAVNLSGEYVDREWVANNLALSVCSRKSNSIDDPLLDLLVHPTVQSGQFVIYEDIDQNGVPTATIYDFAKMKSTIAASIAAPYGKIWTGGTTYVDALTEGSTIGFNDVCNFIRRMMDPVTELEWARVAFGNGDVLDWDGSTAVRYSSVAGYSNTVKDLVNMLNSQIGYFKGCFTALRKVLAIAGRIGLNRWSHINLAVLKTTESPVMYNTTVADILSCICTGGTTLEWDDKTSRWRGFTIFNKYYGIPEFDFYQGGVFLSASLRALDSSADYHVFRRTPRMFAREFPSTDKAYGYNTQWCIAVNRLGEIMPLAVSSTATVGKLYKSLIFGRLTPIPSMNDVQVTLVKNAIRFPVPSVDRGRLSTATVSCFYELIENVFKMGILEYTTSGGNESDFVLNSDLALMIDFEIKDITNTMISYAKENGVFNTYRQSGNAVGFMSKFGSPAIAAD